MTTSAPSAPARAARELVEGASAPDWQSLPRAELLAVHSELAAMRRRVDSALAAASAEVARRSTEADGPGGLARKEGYSTPTRLVAATTGGSTGEAARLIAVGEAMAVPPGETAPRHPHVARAVKEARLSMDAAGCITAMLSRVADAASGEDLLRVEEDLVRRAQTLPLDRLAAFVRQAEASLDLAAQQQAEEARYNARYLNIFESRSGDVIIDGRLDAETAAPIKAAIEGMVTDAMRRRREHALSDQRTAPQMRADAMADLARHALGCDTNELPLSKVSLVVRVGMEEVRTGLGLGEVDGIDCRLSASAIRRMAADAEIIPAVLGGDGEVLDFGRARRLFSRPQRMALVERDGGCAYCHAPPSFTEAHHIRWWERDSGPTDLSNGVLLCTSCHHRIHRDGWEIQVREGCVWFIPPASVDRARTPVLGGRKRFEYQAA